MKQAIREVRDSSPRRRWRGRAFGFRRPGPVVPLGVLSLAMALGLFADTAQDDPLPPLDPGGTSPANWEAWRGVRALIGVSQVDYTYQYDEDVDFLSDHRTSERSSTVFMRLVFDEQDSNSAMQIWRVSEAWGVGTESSAQRTVSQSGGGREYDDTVQGSHTGPMSLRTDPGLTLILEDGAWSFMTLSETKHPWTLAWSGRIRESGQSRDFTDSLPGGRLEHAWMEGIAPKDPVPFTGNVQLDWVAPPGTVAGMEGQHTHSRRALVQFWPEVTDVEVVCSVESLDVLGVDFDQWRPEGSLEDPNAPGPSPLRVQAVLRPRNGQPPNSPLPGVRRFRFELLDTSREPGVCMNWPTAFTLEDPNAPADEDTEFDLRFKAETPEITVLSPKRQKAGVRPHPVPGVTTPAARAELECFDFGAHARLRVIAELSDGREVPGRFERPEGDGYLLPLPLRDEGTRIAKVWRDARRVTDPDAADNDDAPEGDGQFGDGFSVYEEYRGFRVNRRHVSPDPSRKDLFVRVAEAVRSAAEPGIRLMEQATRDGNKPGLRIWNELEAAEMAASRIMNPNRSIRTPRADREPQHGLRIEGYAPSGRLTVSQTVFSGAARRPKSVKLIQLDINETELDRVVAHELAHAIGVIHHGESDLGPVEWSVDPQTETLPDGSSRHYFLEQRYDKRSSGGKLVKLGQPARIRVYLEEDNQEVDPAHPDSADLAAGVGWVSVPGGEHSGTQPCVVRYRMMAPYQPKGGPSDVRILPAPRPRTLPFEPDGTGGLHLPALCRRCQGTGINPKLYGHATVGDCFHQICVRDSAAMKQAPAGLCSALPAAPAKPSIVRGPDLGPEIADSRMAPGHLVVESAGADGVVWRGGPLALRWVGETNPPSGTPLVLRLPDGTRREVPSAAPRRWWLTPADTSLLPIGRLVAEAGGVEVQFSVSDPPAAPSADDVDRRLSLEIRRALDAGRSTEALAMAGEWVSRDPEAPTARKLLGDALASLGRTRDALNEYRESVLRGPWLGEPTPALARVLSLVEARFDTWPLREASPDRTPAEWDQWFIADARGQWASEATASSEYGPRDYSALQATGAPNVPRYGDDRRAWVSRTADGGVEWLQVSFATPVHASGVRVRQVFNPGAITRIELFDTAGATTTVFEGVDATAYERNQISWFLAYFPPTAAPVDRVRITLDTARVRGWNEVDAVQLVAAPAPPPASPAVLSVTFDTATRQIRILWTGAQGVGHRLEAAGSPLGPWSLQDSLPPDASGAAGPWTHSLPAPASSPRFFRLMSESGAP